MSVRTKFHLLSFVVFPVGGLTLVTLGITVHGVFGLLLLPYTLVIGILDHRIRCPSCNKRLLWQGPLMFPYIPKHCQSCGHDLGKRRQSDRA